MDMKVQIPNECPSCASELNRLNDQLFCENDLCDAKVEKQAEKLAKALKIKGLGPKTIGLLQPNHFHEFLTTPLDVWQALLGEKTANKVYDEIQKAIESATMAQVIEGLPVKGIGSVSANKLASVVNNIDLIDYEICKKAGLGDVQTSSLLEWLEYSDPFWDIFEFKQQTVNTDRQTDGQTVCITGKLKDYKTKADAEKVLVALGYRMVDSVTKATNFLVDESGKQSTKYSKAVSLQIPIVTIKDLIERNS